MFAVHPKTVTKIKTQVWVSTNLPSIDSEAKVGEATLLRLEECFIISVSGAEVELNAQKLAMGLIQLDTAQKLTQPQLATIWNTIEDLKVAIDNVKL